MNLPFSIFSKPKEPTVSDLKLYGFSVSPHVRAARIAFQEKRLGIDYQEVSLDHLKTDAYARINPLRKIPALVHGELTLFETPALLVYADGIGSGPALIPSDATQAARMWQFVGLAQTQLYPVGAMTLYFHAVLAGVFGMAPDPEAGAAAIPPTALHLDLLEAGLHDGWLAGGGLSLADLYCGAMVDYVERARDGRALIDARPRVRAWLDALQARDSFKMTVSPLLSGTDQV